MVMLAAPGGTLAGGDDTSDYRAEIIENYVDPCSLSIVHQNPATHSIPKDDITLVVRSFTRAGLEEMLDLWVPKVKAMTEAERRAFYENRLDWCIATDLGTKERENIQDVAEALE